MQNASTATTVASDTDILAAARRLQHSHGASLIAGAARKLLRAWGR